MLANYERRYFEDGAKVWLGRYYDLKSIAHWHNEIELIYVIKGSLRIGVNSETFLAKEGDFVVCNSGDIHYCDSEEGSTISDILIFKEELVKPVNLSYSLVCPYIPAEELERHHLKARSLIGAISNELKNKERFYNEVVCSLLTDFFARCYRCLPCRDIRFKVQNNRQNILQSFQLLFEHIDNNYAFLDFSAAARFMHFTPSYFSRVFKSISGTTFTEYINQIKIEKALEMIKKGDLSITHISIKCGFDSTRNFNRVFKKLTGITPTEVTSDFTLNYLTQAKTPTEESFNPTVHVSKVIVRT